jgi:hypothetical protein
VGARDIGGHIGRIIRNVTLEYQDMLELYPPGTRVWLADNDQGWISGTVVAATGVPTTNGMQLKVQDDHGKARRSRGLE